MIIINFFNQNYSRKKMKLVSQIVLVLVILGDVDGQYSYEPVHENQCKCQAYSRKVNNSLVSDYSIIELQEDENNSGEGHHGSAWQQDVLSGQPLHVQCQVWF